MQTLEELKHHRDTLIKEINELDTQIQQAEVTLKDIKRTTIKQQFKQALGTLLKLIIWVSFFLVRIAFFYYLCRPLFSFRWMAVLFAIWLSCGSDFLYTEGKAWIQEIWKRRKM
ncbi:hypothetical protein CWM22_09150 [Streptococcus suis]|nr:hypothetical protein CWM22_09150 [Streptococcus suis]